MMAKWPSGTTSTLRLAESLFQEQCQPGAIEPSKGSTLGAVEGLKPVSHPSSLPSYPKTNYARGDDYQLQPSLLENYLRWEQLCLKEELGLAAAAASSYHPTAAQPLSLA